MSYEEAAKETKGENSYQKPVKTRVIEEGQPRRRYVELKLLVG